MKKIMSLSLAIWFLIATCSTLPSCYSAGDGTGGTKAADDVTSRKETTTTVATATVADVATATVTDSESATGSITNTEAWELRDYVDEFGLSTGKSFISTTVYDGKFSNSATTNSKLTAVMQVDKDDVMIILYEYARNQVKCSYKSDQYSITMLDTNNEKHYLSGTMYNGGFRIYIADAYRSTVLNALKGSGTVRFYVVLSDRITTTYSFSIETSNFRDAYNLLQ